MCVEVEFEYVCVSGGSPEAKRREGALLWQGLLMGLDTITILYVHGRTQHAGR